MHLLLNFLFTERKLLTRFKLLPLEVLVEVSTTESHREQTMWLKAAEACTGRKAAPPAPQNFQDDN